MKEKDDEITYNLTTTLVMLNLMDNDDINRNLLEIGMMLASFRRHKELKKVK